MNEDLEWECYCDFDLNYLLIQRLQHGCTRNRAKFEIVNIDASCIRKIDRSIHRRFIEITFSMNQSRNNEQQCVIVISMSFGILR